MSNTDPSDDPGITRRRVLRETGGTVGLLGLGTGRVAADDSREAEEHCSETTLEPSVVHYDDSIHEVCDDDHPASREIQADVGEALERKYPTVGALIDDGFVPYLDFFADGDWSHWINPEYIGDGSMVDPERPESVLVDHTWWRPIGVMFVATDEGEPVDRPPSVYTEEGEAARTCLPWHAHVGLPGRHAWWKYRNAYGGTAGRSEGGYPCRTPWMMHVWIHAHPESIYAHAAPDARGGPPASPAGFDTDADPGEEALGPEHLPDMLRGKVMQLW